LGTERTNWRTGTWKKRGPPGEPPSRPCAWHYRKGRLPVPYRKTPPRSHSRRLCSVLWRTHEPRFHTSGSSGTPFPRDPARRRPWDRNRWPRRGRSPGVPERCGVAWWSRDDAGDRAGRGGRPTAWLVVWTTGFFVEWHGPGWPPAAPGVERSESFGLDVKDGKGLGRWNGGCGLSPAAERETAEIRPRLTLPGEPGTHRAPSRKPPGVWGGFPRRSPGPDCRWRTPPGASPPSECAGRPVRPTVCLFPRSGRTLPGVSSGGG
jgi:hypothetical protein